MKELEKYDTLYFFCPFADVAQGSLPLGYAPAGEIIPIEAPRRPIPAWDLPEKGAETLGFAKHQNVEVFQRVAPGVIELDHVARQVVNTAVVFYLEEPRPVLSILVQNSMSQGGMEITALRGMPKGVFEKLNLNEAIFGTPRPKTADVLRKKMMEHINRAEKDQGEAAQKMASIAAQIIDSVNRCLGYTAGVLRDTHAQMDLAKAGNPDGKFGYDQRDMRAMEFSGAVPRDEAMNLMARQHQEMQASMPVVLDHMAKMEERWMTMFADMQAERQAEREERAANTQAMLATVDAMKAIAANAGGGAQPDQKTEEKPKTKKS